VESGGLSLLLNLLESSKDETIRRVVVGAIANLAMNGKTLLNNVGFSFTIEICTC
jgi:hypothetical protein